MTEYTTFQEGDVVRVKPDILAFLSEREQERLSSLPLSVSLITGCVVRLRFVGVKGLLSLIPINFSPEDLIVIERLKSSYFKVTEDY